MDQECDYHDILTYSLIGITGLGLRAVNFVMAGSVASFKNGVGTMS